MPLKRLSPKGISRRYASLMLGAAAGAVCLMAMLKVCSSPHPFASDEFTHSGGDTLDVAIQYAPLMLYSYDDTLGGFAYDLLREMADRQGLSIKFHPMVSLNDALERLCDGNYDMIVAELPRTDNFLDRVSFTEPVYLDRMVLVQPKSDSLSISSQLDLAGKDVWVPVNSPAMTRLRNLSYEIGDTIHVHCDLNYGPEQLFIMVATGEISLAVINRTTAEVMAGEYDNVDINTSISFTQFQSWLVNASDSMFKAEIDSCIVSFRSTDAYRDLLSRYGISGPSSASPR